MRLDIPLNGRAIWVQDVLTIIWLTILEFQNDNQFKEDLEDETRLFENTDDASLLFFLISFLYSPILINLNLPNMVFTLQNIFKFTPSSA